MKGSLFLCVAVLSIGLLGAKPEQLSGADNVRWWDLVPAEESPFGGGGAPDGATEKETEVIKREAFEKWVVYEDEYVKFRYPKHPFIKLNVRKPKTSIKVEGGVCTTVDNSYQQAYVLRVGKATYGVFLLNPSKWLDDGICLCGPMVYDAYRLRNGTVTRFSMLPGGAVKKAQVVGGGLRFMAFEWTHLACPRKVYEKMVNSMVLKTRERGGNEALRNKLIEKYGDDAKIGMLHKGSPAQKLIALYGAPQQKQQDPEHEGSEIWSWSWKGENYPCSLTARISLKEQTLISFPSVGVSRDHDNPIHGSIAWVAKTLDDRENQDDDKPKLPALTEKEKQIISGAITKELNAGLVDLKSANNETPRRWLIAVSLAKSAHTIGIQSQQWGRLVLENGKGLPHEVSYLEEAKPEGTAQWLLKFIKSPSPIPPSMMMFGSDTLEMLLTALHDTYPEVWKKECKNLWDTGDSELKAALLLSYFELGIKPATVNAWVVDTFEKCVTAKNHEMAKTMMSILNEILADGFSKEQRSQLILHLRKLPEGKKDTQWHNSRKALLKSLK
ncbi:MAG: hypothetical protein ACPG6P_09215 [Akkermansiaceae bacterium]